MSRYRRLMLSDGGGVFSTSQQDEQNNCGAIGLGITGIEPRMESAGKYVPLYQAFVTYIGLSKEEKKRLLG
ncbi:hypothetical protein [Butyrivibrio sp. VCB2001]|uniref:hypothetical protein n=1 Tax=Butyrivibrio sp. VCB2001 TaxID=1280667 RepID=UPI0003F75B0E|nr:hypothetical protein [Butyrivibrio sp. VCB2001]